ncbi:hypothetical protein KIF24_24585 [Micromonospora sp. Llam7]|uniref:hypothetical protein n=1 Tax=Micromonospora tarapacensis TaxID=2835305 RepID=UPI001C833245|nr:hypothetical protein [Micromonospora tarapacensis]MBX7268891.1 hypothetical protein [Micromonospora tarapacensis]
MPVTPRDGPSGKGKPIDILGWLLVAVRRWYVSVPGLLATIGAVALTGAMMQPEYKMSATVLLVPPTAKIPKPVAGRPPEPGNPWLTVGEAGMARAVAVAVSAAQVRERVRLAGGDPDYEISQVDRGAILTVDVAARSSDEAIRTAAAVIGLIDEEVAGRQRPHQPGPGEAIGVEVLDEGGVDASRMSILRTQLIVAGTGLAVSMIAAAAYGTIARRARARAGNTRRPTGRMAVDTTK